MEIHPKQLVKTFVVRHLLENALCGSRAPRSFTMMGKPGGKKKQKKQKNGFLDRKAYSFKGSGQLQVMIQYFVNN